MKVRLLPSNPIDPHLQPLTTFLLNEAMAIDGGSLGFALSPEAQRAVRDIVVTHTHADHIASLPIFVAEVFPFLDGPVTVYGTREVISGLCEHVFNDAIWPNFHELELPGGGGPALCYTRIEPLVPFEAAELRITPVAANHTVPTVGLVVEGNGSAVLFTSDTYHTDEIWRVGNTLETLAAVFVDVSYPNEMETLAEDSRHLTPRGLDVELRKLTKEVPIYAVHLKPQFRDETIKQLLSLRRPNVMIAEIGRDYVF